MACFSDISLVSSVMCTCRLQEVADFIVERLVSAGVMEREYDRVKLHATVINTKLRKAASSGKPREAHGGGRKGPGRQGFEPRETFDASSILQVSEYRFHMNGSGTQ